MTLSIEENIARLKVSMNELAGVHIFESLYELINYKFFMDFLKYSCSDDNMEI